MELSMLADADYPPADQYAPMPEGVHCTDPDQNARSPEGVQRLRTLTATLFVFAVIALALVLF
jgi:hypothetical protein